MHRGYWMCCNLLSAGSFLWTHKHTHVAYVQPMSCIWSVWKPCKHCRAYTRPRKHTHRQTHTMYLALLAGSRSLASTSPFSSQDYSSSSPSLSPSLHSASSFLPSGFSLQGRHRRRAQVRGLVDLFNLSSSIQEEIEWESSTQRILKLKWISCKKRSILFKVFPDYVLTFRK